MVLFASGDYRFAFIFLGFPAFIALLTLIYTKLIYTDSVVKEEREEGDHLKSHFFMYVVASGFVAMGYVDFALLAYHLKQNISMPDGWIPLVYAVAIGVDAVFALLFGILFDRIGFYALMLGIFVASAYPLFAFSLSLTFAFLGIVLWGLGMGIQESIMRSAIAKLTPPEARGKAFGIFHFFQVSFKYLIAFSVACQLLSLVPMFILSKSFSAKSRSSG